MTASTRRPLVVLGPTASGKSAAAMALAARNPRLEIVAVDSMQVYRGMDIGTAKPTAGHQAAVRHHCLDLVDPAEEFTVAQFTSAAASALDDIGRRGAHPLYVAGTGLYLRALTDPMDMPGRWPEVRAGLESRLSTEGAAVLHGELARLDALAASRIEPGNGRRVVRALEVTIGSGRPFSSFGPGITTYPPVGVDLIGLQWDRDVLRQRIAERVDVMFADGLLAEVEHLAGQPIGRTARQALGYKELFDHLEGRCTLEESRATIVRRTQQFAVRQERWFRRDPRVRWIRVERDPVGDVLAAVAGGDARSS